MDAWRRWKSRPRRAGEVALAKRDTPARQSRTTGGAQPAPTPEEAPAESATTRHAREKGRKAGAAGESGSGARSDRKPMSVEEAMMAPGRRADYVVYAHSGVRSEVRVLIRRRDGKVDLVEGLRTGPWRSVGKSRSASSTGASRPRRCGRAGGHRRERARAKARF